MATVKANHNLYEMFPDLDRCFELIDRGICEKDKYRKIAKVLLLIRL